MTKLNWGMIGGGEGSQIGPAHRLGAAVDGEFAFVAGALDHRPDAGRDYGQRLGLAADRAYGDWREMLEGERSREDRVDLVTVATPTPATTPSAAVRARIAIHGSPSLAGSPAPAVGSAGVKRPSVPWRSSWLADRGSFPPSSGDPWGK